MINFLLKTENGSFDFENPIDVESPNLKIFESLTPLTKVFLVEYDKEHTIKFCLEKDIMLIMKSILSLYPSMFFNLNPQFFSDNKNTEALLKTSLHTINVRAKQDTNHKYNPILFEKQARNHIQNITSEK